MLEPWNDATKVMPPINTAPCEKGTDIQGLNYILQNVTKTLSKQSPLHKESALLSRFLYKFDKKMRNDIGYRHLRKVNTALKKYLALNLLKDVETFYAVLPSNNDNNLPTRQLLEYIMVRLIAFSKIMQRICICAKQSAVIFMDRIKRGEGHWMSLMPYAVLSRIWCMSKVLLQHSCTWYSGLHPFLEKLVEKGINFLPPNYTLPLSLDYVLDIENIDDYGRFEWSNIKQEFDFDTLEDDDRLESILNYINEQNDEGKDIQIDKNDAPEKLITALDVGETISRDSFKSLEKVNKTEEQDPVHIQIKNEKAIHTPKTLDRAVDTGETISRDSFKHLLKEIKIPVARKVHSAETVSNKASLHKFISAEEKFRNNGSEQSLTKHLSFMQWLTLKNAMTKLHDALAKDRKIEKKFQKLWKDKCLDYMK